MFIGSVQLSYKEMIKVMNIKQEFMQEIYLSLLSDSHTHNVQYIGTFKPLLLVETFSWNLCVMALRTNFTKVVLHNETLVFVTTAIVVTVAEVESGSTFRETFLTKEVKWCLEKLTMLQGATPSETWFATSLHTSSS